ncbi:amidohydrolase family protein [Zobellella sp. DQSA1]|uniref:amidohydrolase family protein n=1 Tax=Zobellella sp. DQSA1 TaxID=3342386 RepID=UPI0035C17648
MARELALIGQSGASAVICPIVSGRHAKYFSGVRRFREAGINISLGTDTYPSDMIQNMHVGAILSRVESGDITEASAADYYNMATLGGARALGREDLGRLSPGAKADIMVFDFDRIHSGQCSDPVTAMVINGNGRDIQLIRYGSSDEAYLDLRSGRVDVVFSDVLAIQEGFIKREGGDDFVMKGPLVTDSRWFGEGSGIAVRKQDVRLKERLNQAILALRDNGEYQKINARYFDFDIYGE